MAQALARTDFWVCYLPVSSGEVFDVVVSTVGKVVSGSGVYKGAVAWSLILLLFKHEVMSDSFVIPRTVAHQASLSVRFSRQEYWSGLPFPLQGIFLNQGLKPHLLSRQADSALLSHQ